MSSSSCNVLLFVVVLAVCSLSATMFSGDASEIYGHFPVCVCRPVCFRGMSTKNSVSYSVSCTYYLHAPRSDSVTRHINIHICITSPRRRRSSVHVPVSFISLPILFCLSTVHSPIPFKYLGGEQLLCVQEFKFSQSSRANSYGARPPLIRRPILGPSSSSSLAGSCTSFTYSLQRRHRKLEHALLLQYVILHSCYPQAKTISQLVNDDAL